jgi:catechol 2,3-dioxygenase-like lactoylglutathione lyase family enzyme
MKEDPMFDHVSIGVRDTAKARKFYDASLKPLGIERRSDSPESIGYGRDGVTLWVSTADSPVKADPNSGLHFCFVAPSRSAVDAFYAEGLKAGGKDNGAPGLRPDYGPSYYAAFLIDPDGYRLEAYCGAAS